MEDFVNEEVRSDGVFRHLRLQNGLTRHHIIPLLEMANLGVEWIRALANQEVNDVDTAIGILEQNNVFLEIRELIVQTPNVNLGQYIVLDARGADFMRNHLANEYEQAVCTGVNQIFAGCILLCRHQNREDTSTLREAFGQIFAWLPGNLVIGPNNRANDPGNEFDEEAYHLAIEVQGEQIPENEPNGMFELMRNNDMGNFSQIEEILNVILQFEISDAQNLDWAIR